MHLGAGPVIAEQRRADALEFDVFNGELITQIRDQLHEVVGHFRTVGADRRITPVPGGQDPRRLRIIPGHPRLEQRSLPRH